MESKDQHIVNEPDMEYSNYSYADYLNWTLDEVVELIKGKVFKKAAAAPGRRHQRISMHLGSELFQFLKGKPCEVFHAPFDVRLPVKSKKNSEIDTVVQPDICVVCDLEKLDEAGCVGAPDLVVEILSPGNTKKELKLKYEVYKESEVKEYWVVYPIEQSMLIYTLENGEYKASRLLASGDKIKSKVIPGFSLDLDELFSSH